MTAAPSGWPGANGHPMFGRAMSEPASITPVAPRPHRRVALFVVFSIVLTLAAVEAVAFVGIWIQDKRPFTPGRLQLERAAIVEEFDTEGPAGLTDTPDAPHPYLGFVRNPDLQETISEFGYPESTPLFTRRADDRVVIAVVGGSVAFHFAKQGLPTVSRCCWPPESWAGYFRP